MAPTPVKPAKKLGGKLGRKVGPLPLWGWLALATFALVLFFLWRRRSTTGPRSVETVTGNTTSTADPSPQELASGGGPPSWAPQDSLSPEVLAELNGRFGDIEGSVTDLYGGLASVNTSLDSQTNALEGLTQAVAKVTLGPPGAAAATATNPVTTKTANGVEWGGRRFTTRQALGKWLDARGSTYAVWAQRHPEASKQLSGPAYSAPKKAPVAVTPTRSTQNRAVQVAKPAEVKAKAKPKPKVPVASVRPQTKTRSS